ncbi:MAG: lipid-A-disaccharide synthase, partial [Raineya sp.]
MKYYLVVGERSGDMHASNLKKAQKKLDPKAEFRFFGGEQMQAIGGTLVKHYQEMAVMGFWEVLKNLRKITALLKFCKKDILTYQPDVVILVDFAGFNMRIAKFCKKNHIKNFYYISPKVWAWNTKRAWKIKENVDKMFVIFPFEKDFYKQFD